VSRLLVATLTTLLLLFATGCGNVFVRGTFGASTFQGTVSTVQVNVNGTVQVTFVSFEQSGAPLVIGFCGDQTSFFPVNQTVQVDFNPGPVCATVVTVVIIV
jgi:hypothetical protein